MSQLSKARRRYVTSLQYLGGGDIPPGFLRWSSLATWGGSFPASGVDLTLGSGSKIYYDVNMLDADAPGKITVETGAQVIVDPTLNTRLVADSLLIPGGSFTAGSALLAHASDFHLDMCGRRPTVSGNTGGGALRYGITHDLTTDVSTGNNGTTNDYYGVNRALIVSGVGKLKLYGKTAPMQRRLNAPVVPGFPSATTITVDTPVTARAGSIVFVTPDGFFNDARRTEKRTLAVAAVGSTTLVLNTPLTFARFGQLQYATDTGISLSPGAFTLRTVGNPTGMRARTDQNPVIDQRAFVVVIDPSMQIRGYDVSGRGTDLASYGYGFHGMQMDLTSEVYCKNIHTDQYGQLGLLGRYGLTHVHLPSYDTATGAAKTNGYLGTNKYQAGWSHYEAISGINGFNRFADLHATKGSIVTNCIGIDAQGHAFFEEDGSEEENEYSYNLAINPRDPGSTYRLKAHDSQTTGFWFSNMNNTHVENWCVDNKYGGPFWNACSTGLIDVQGSNYQRGCLGSSYLVPIAPAFGKMGVWNGNSGLGCAGFAFSNNGTLHNSGKITINTQKLVITTDGVAGTVLGAGGGFPNWVELGFKLENMRLFKTWGYNHVTSSPNYLNGVMADLSVTGYSGISDSFNGAIDGAILVRESLNHESNALASTPTFGFVPYHGTMRARNISGYGYKGAVYSLFGGNGGAVEKVSLMPTWDDYVQPINDYAVLNPNWCTFDCDTIWQTPPAHLTESTTTYDAITGTAVGSVKYQAYGGRKFNIGIRYDHFGLEGVGPGTSPQPNTHIVFNQPFYTTGAAGFTPLAHNPESGITTTPYMGLDFYQNGYNGENANRVIFQRCDSSGTDIAGAVLGPMNAFNRTGYDLLPFHHAAIPVGGFVKVLWPDDAAPTASIGGTFTCGGTGFFWNAANPNLNTATDVTYWRIPYDAATSFFQCAGQAYSKTGITSLAALIAAPNGFNYFHDTANKYVWVRLRVHPSNNQWSLSP